MKSDTKPNPVASAWSTIRSKTSGFTDGFTQQQMMLFVILVIAFVQGVVTLADLSVQYLYKDDYHMSPAEVSIASGITGLPWIVKPVWGMISDNIPLFGYRRKSYLMLLGFIGAMCWFCLSTFQTSPVFGVILLLTSSVSVAFNSVIGEALIVEAAQQNNNRASMTEEERQSEASNNVSFFFGVKSIGVLVTSYTGGWLLGFTSKYTIFYITMLFPLFAGLSSWLLPERRVGGDRSFQRIPTNEPSSPSRTDDFGIVPNNPEAVMGAEAVSRIRGEVNSNNTSNNQSSSQNEEAFADAASNWSKITKFISNPAIYKPVLFIFVFCMTPSTGSAMFFYYTNKLGFSTEFMGEIQLASAVASIIGIWIFNRYFKNTSFVKIFTWSAIICTFANLTQIMLVLGWNEKIGLPNKFFCLTGNLLIQVFAELNVIPILVLACRICPKNVEGTMYALLMSVLNFGSMISNEWGAINTWALGITETNFDNLWILIFIASISIIAPLPFIHMIDFDSAVKMSEGGEAEKTEDEIKIEETIREKTEDMLGEGTCHTKYTEI